MNVSNSRRQFEFFCLAFFVCMVAIWFTTIVKKDYVVFTDEESVPAPADVFTDFPSIVKGIWTH